MIDPNTFRSLRSRDEVLLVEGADCPPEEILKGLSNSEVLRDFCEEWNLPFGSVYEFLNELGDAFHNAYKPRHSSSRR